MNRILATILSVVLAFGGLVSPKSIEIFSFGSVSAVAENQAELWSYKEFTYNGETGIELTKYNGSQTDVYIPSKLTVEGEEKAVLKVGDSLFKDNTAINSATLGDGIKVIGDSAFKGAAGLVCIVTNDNLEKIGVNAFDGCTNFNSVILYDSVMEIGTDAFKDCGRLTIYCNQNSRTQLYCEQNHLNYILLTAGDTPLIIEEGGLRYYIQYGGAAVISSDEDLKGDIQIPATVQGFPVTEIGAQLFAYREGISSVTMPDTVTKIGDRAFCGNSIESITLSQSLSELGESSFENCINLRQLSLPYGVTEIPQDFAYGCSSLEALDIPGSVKIIGTKSFYCCEALDHVIIPDGVIEIRNDAFACTGIKYIEISGSVKTIDSGIVDSCNNLKKIVIYDGITELRSEMFGYAPNLKIICLPASIASMPDDMFANSKNAVLYIYENSYTHTFAESKSIPYVLISSPDDIPDVQDETYEVDGMTFRIKNNEAVLVDCEDTVTGDVVIPDKVHGYPVTEIGRDIFTWQHNYNITKLTIPDTVKAIENETFQGFKVKEIIIPDTLSYIGDYALADTNIETLELGNSITHIGEGAFCNNSQLISVTFPSGVTELPKNIFYNCSSLRHIAFQNDITSIGTGAFEKCSALASITLPDSVEAIGERAFSKCTSLREITIPEKVTSIGAGAFEQCDKLTDITLPDSINSIGRCAFSQCSSLEKIKMPKKVTDISDNMFYECYALKDVTLPEKLAKIKFNAFYQCSSLEELTLPETVTDIDLYAFYSCRQLKTINLPPNLTSIGESAFSLCGLTEITIPESITKIGNGAFNSCQQLTDITLPQNMTTVTRSIFSGCSALESITLPDSLTEIDDYAFSWCRGLKNITIPENVERIGEGAFQTCSALESITLPDSVSDIGISAFEDCSSLKSISIPKNLKKISKGLFLNCTAMTEFTIPDNIQTIESDALPNSPDIPFIILPASITHMEVFKADYTIYVYEGSYAHQFMDENGMQYVLMSGGAEEPEFIKKDNLTYCILGDYAALYEYDVTVGAELDEYGKPIIDKEKVDTVIVDSAINGLPVKRIMPRAFADYPYINGTIELPDTIEEIGANAFAYSNAKEINIPTGVKKIGQGAFMSTAIHELTLPDNVELQNGGDGILSWSQISSLTIGNGMTSIPDNMFSGCSHLKEIDIPSTVESIGNSAFAYSGIESIAFPDNLQSIGDSAFASCQSLSNITLPAIPSLGRNVFFGCNGLKKVIVEDGVSVIPAGMFGSCGNLSSVEIRAELNSIGEGAFASCTALEKIELPKVKELNKDIFKNCTNLKTIIIGEGVTEIPDYMFTSLKNIEKVVLPSTVKSIGHCAFENCDKITEITLPDGLETVGVRTFCSCIGLTEVTLSKSLSALSTEMFANCENLKKVQFNEGLKSIGWHAFNNCPLLEEINLPQGVTEIDDGAFGGCKSLRTITLPEGFKSIGLAAFMDCENLETLAIPEGVTGLANSLLWGCKSLKRLSLPSTLRYIGGNSIYNCTSLVSVVIPDRVNSIDGLAFDGSHTILCVKENSDAYFYAKENNIYYFVIPRTSNPEVSYGTGITGTVAYTDGTAAANAEVSILYDDGTVKQSVQTDDNGKYEFTYAEVGQYTILVKDAAGNTGSESVSVKRINAFDVFLMGTTNITLKNGWNVSGKVSPANAKITITDQNGNVMAETTAENGSYTIPDIPNGEYIVKAETEDGSAVKEINVFDGDVELDTITIEKAAPMEVSGTVYAQSRAGANYTKTWAQVIIYNTNGTTVASTRTDENGLYNFGKLPAGEYYLVAETMELREDKAPLRFFDRPYALRGYTYINVTETKINGDTDIVMLEQSDKTVRFEGSVRTAGGQYLACDLTLYDIFKNELDKLSITNGRFYATIPEGIYRISAVTADGRTGYTTIGLFKGKPQGSANIIVSRSEKIIEHENNLAAIPDCTTYAEANEYRDTIVSEKRFYDSLSRIEKNELSREYVNKLSKLVELLSRYNWSWGGIWSLFSADDSNEKTITGTICNGGLLVSADELSQGKEVTLSVAAKEIDATTIDENGISTGDEYVQLEIEDAAADKTIGAYYDISLVKTVDDNEQAIKDISKNTDSTGKLQITLPIPSELQKEGRSFSFIHAHNGDIATLADMDDSDETITVETDKFSTFVLAYTDDTTIAENDTEIVETELNLLPQFADKMSVKMTNDSGTIAFIASKTENTAFSETDKLAVYVAYYDDNNVLENVSKYSFTGDNYTLFASIAKPVSDNYRIFIWTNRFEPVIAPITKVTNKPLS